MGLDKILSPTEPPVKQNVTVPDANQTQQQHPQTPWSALGMNVQNSIGNQAISRRVPKKATGEAIEEEPSKQGKLKRKLEEFQALPLILDEEQEQEATDVQAIQNEAETTSDEDDKDGPYFWSRAVVRTGSDQEKLTADKYMVKGVSISPERRLTAREKDQGDHLVAWSAMYRYWNSQLRGPLSDVLAKLRGWILDDQTADKDLTGKNEPLRKKALFLVDTMASGELQVNQINDYLEHAVSLFVEANQHSSFAVQGKASGGKDEGRSQLDLEAYNKSLTEGQKPADIGIADAAVKDRALQLIDVTGKQLDDVTRSKAVYTWYTMLCGQFPKLVPTFEDTLLGHEIKGKTVAQLLADWKNTASTKAAASEQSLKQGRETMTLADAANKDKKTGVLAAVGSVTAPALQASEVSIEQLEIPEKIRAKTRFDTTQGSHTLAWTFERQSLMALFKNRSVEEVLTKLADLTRLEQKSLELGQSHLVALDVGMLKSSADVLLSQIEHDRGQQYSIQDWIDAVNRNFSNYVQLNQLLPTTAYKAAGTALGHGEASANAAFREAREKPDKYNYAALKQLATKYIDSGIFYVPLLHKLANYASSPRVAKPMTTASTSKSGNVDLTAAFLGFLTPSRLSTAAIQQALHDCTLEQLDLVQQASREAMRRLNGEPSTDTQLKKTKLATGPVESLVGESLKFALDTKGRKSTTLHNRLRDTVLPYLEILVSHHPDTKDKAAAKHTELSNEVLDPKTMLQSLYVQEKPALRKIFGDFYAHLAYFHPQFHTDFQADDTGKAEFVEEVLKAPLLATDIVIGQPIMIHLMSDYNSFIVAFREGIEEKAAEWASELLPSPDTGGTTASTAQQESAMQTQ
ncbi:hypothetical protein [Paenibacillus sp. 1P07SE]|uniref:hypothetical protein n=1 Tax=Paenibacillus sp. 1P07SE TaxID=3132209 RepID=UPI0039A74459